jgi:hypothetical protein
MRTLGRFPLSAVRERPVALHTRRSFLIAYDRGTKRSFPLRKECTAPLAVHKLPSPFSTVFPPFPLERFRHGLRAR